MNRWHTNFTPGQRRWHHVAVTWRSDTGQALLYDNGRLAWEVVRGKGRRIPSGGTLVVGREQGTHTWLQA
jgi:Pentaxin family